MRVEEQFGRKIMCEELLPPEKIVVGSQWQDSSGAVIKVTEVDEFGWVTYEGKSQPLNEKDSFSFQCRYSMILEG
jgi:hypothetical protein